jgi:hypothetical protein
MEVVGDSSVVSVVIKFLVVEEKPVGNIHKCLCFVYGSATVDRSTVGRWVKRVTASEKGKEELYDSCSEKLAGWPGMIRTKYKHTHIPSWRKAVEVDGDFVEKWNIETKHDSSLCVIFMI